MLIMNLVLVWLYMQQIDQYWSSISPSIFIHWLSILSANLRNKDKRRPMCTCPWQWKLVSVSFLCQEGMDWHAQKIVNMSFQPITQVVTTPLSYYSRWKSFLKRLALKLHEWIFVNNKQEKVVVCLNCFMYWWYNSVQVLAIESLRMWRAPSDVMWTEVMMWWMLPSLYKLHRMWKAAWFWLELSNLHHKIYVSWSGKGSQTCQILSFSQLGSKHGAVLMLVQESSSHMKTWIRICCPWIQNLPLPIAMKNWEKNYHGQHLHHYHQPNPMPLMRLQWKSMIMMIMSQVKLLVKRKSKLWAEYWTKLQNNLLQTPWAWKWTKQLVCGYALRKGTWTIPVQFLPLARCSLSTSAKPLFIFVLSACPFFLAVVLNLLWKSCLQGI